MDKQANTKKPHIFEIDLIRSITVFTVVAVHSLSYTTQLTNKLATINLLNLIGHTLHYNRQMFMFITGLVLTYVYFHRQYSVKQFWRKRVLLVFIPYVLWTIIYTWYNNLGLSVSDYGGLMLKNILTGGASFQLYYILLALEFYALFPIFLAILKKVARHPWIVLGISFLIQVGFLFFDFYFLQKGPWSKIPWVKDITDMQDKIIFTYQFFFVLGAFAAVYMEKSTDFLKKYGRYLLIVFPAALFLYIAYYYGVALALFHEQPAQATSVLQPTVAFYSVVVIFFFSWIAIHWAKKRPFYTIIHIISDTSFGIYFVHVFILTLIMNHLLYPFDRLFPLPITAILVLAIAFSTSVLFCYILLKIPFLSWTIGRAQPLTSPLPAMKIFARKTYHQKKHFTRFFRWLSIILLFLTIGVLLKQTSFSNAPPHHNIHLQSMPEKPTYTLPNIPPQDPHVILDQPVTTTGCGAHLALSPGTTTVLGISFDDTHRTYRLYLPKLYNNDTLHPLLLNFHGYASSPLQQERRSQFDPLADTYNFIAVYPQGTRDNHGIAGWNTGLHKGISTNDVLFVSNLLNQLQSNFCIDANRIYATGFSNGGGFVNLLTCNMARRIAAFAPVSGSYIRSSSCDIDSPLSIIEFHGTADRVVPYNGNKRHREYPVLSWIKSLAKVNDCSGKSKVFYTGKKVVGYNVTQCDNHASIVHYKLVGGHHTWPSMLFRTQIDGEKREVDVAGVIWSFFEKHPLGST